MRSGGTARPAAVDVETPALRRYPELPPRKAPTGEHLMQRPISSALIAVFISTLAATPAAAQALPAAWPNRLELGMSDAPGGAAAMKATAPFAFRYQYLSGGVNTGQGWSTWNENGNFARFYIEDSIANGIVPVFTYYTLLQSLPRTGGSEGAVLFNNLNDTGTM